MELRFNALRENRSLMLPDLLTRIEETEKHDLPDQVFNLADLKMNAAQNMVIPGQGDFALTAWSRRQIANLLGVKFDRWFENADNEEKAYELNRRLNRASGQIKLRATGLTDDGVYADGTLKAFVSPTYTAVSDSLLGNLIWQAVRQCSDAVPVIRASQTDKTFSYAIRIGEPFNSTSRDSVGSIFGGIQVTNSGVGFASLSVSLHLMRLVCTNGMTAPVAGANLLRRRHVGRPEEDLWSRMAEIVKNVPEKLGYAVHSLRESQNKRVTNAQSAIEAVIRQAHMPGKLLEPFMMAYNKEPHDTVFGVAQAITDYQTHEQLGLAPEDRKQLEDAAATYIANAS